jgi:glycosyltransferase involved in cell wall biosynthesis
VPSDSAQASPRYRPSGSALTEPLRILFCNFEYPPLGGGGGVINALLAAELAKRHEVTVLTSRGLGTPAESTEDGVRVVRVPVFFRTQQAAANIPSMLAYLPMGAHSGKKLLCTTRFDIINTHFVLPSGPVGDVLARYGHIPNVLSVHGGDVYDPSKWTSPHRHILLRAWIRRLLRRAECVVGQSRNTLDNMRKYYAPEIEGRRIPLGIKRPQIEAGSRLQYGFGEHDVLLVTVGRLVARKAIDQLVRMMAQIASANVYLLVLGNGPLAPALQELARGLGVEKRIRFLGYVNEEEKFRILQLSDIFVSTSQHEGFGLVFLEAMASGLPVVCYDHGGQTDFLEHRRTGCVVPLNDETSFAEHCQRLIHDQNGRRQMGKENLRRVEEFFIDRCAARYEDVFSEVIAQYRRANRIGHSGST